MRAAGAVYGTYGAFKYRVGGARRGWRACACEAAAHGAAACGRRHAARVRQQRRASPGRACGQQRAAGCRIPLARRRTRTPAAAPGGSRPRRARAAGSRPGPPPPPPTHPPHPPTHQHCAAFGPLIRPHVHLSIPTHTPIAPPSGPWALQDPVHRTKHGPNRTGERGPRARGQRARARDVTSGWELCQAGPPRGRCGRSTFCRRPWRGALPAGLTPRRRWPARSPHTKRPPQPRPPAPPPPLAAVWCLPGGRVDAAVLPVAARPMLLQASGGWPPV